MDIPNHSLPTYSEEARNDALFHYTNGNGLLGILSKNELWSTAYYCVNDESELSVGKGVLTRMFSLKTHEMIAARDPRVKIFFDRGVDILKDYAQNFERSILGTALSELCVYISCFCKANGKEDFLHGLLSQWRGYGSDGGYALQFSRSKLQARVDQAYKQEDLSCELQDIYYSPQNPLRKEVEKRSTYYVDAYMDHLDRLVNWNGKFENTTEPSPISNLKDGSLEALLDYFINTKSEHFREENECRLNFLGAISPGYKTLPVDYFNRNGLIVPYTKTSQSFNVRDCIEWIIVGPSPRMTNRYNAIRQMVRKMGLNIDVRPSHIPYSNA
jgi:hypothetical protein